MTAKRWSLCDAGVYIQSGDENAREWLLDYDEFVQAEDYDAIAAALAIANAKLGEPGYIECCALREALEELSSKQNDRIRDLEAAANEVLRIYMPQFESSLTVDDCLVRLAAAVAGVATTETKGEQG